MCSTVESIGDLAVQNILEALREISRSCDDGETLLRILLGLLVQETGEEPPPKGGRCSL